MATCERRHAEEIGGDGEDPRFADAAQISDHQDRHESQRQPTRIIHCETDASAATPAAMLTATVRM